MLNLQKTNELYVFDLYISEKSRTFSVERFLYDILVFHCVY